jgi:hypothetical protein
MLQPRFLGSASLVLTAVLGACSKTATGPSTYAVAYELTASAGVSFDSVKYDDGHGTLIKVSAPSSGWLKAISVASGGTVEAHAWVVASGGGQTVKLTATWTLSGVSTNADSSGTTTSAAGTFALDIAKRQL